MGTVKNTKFEDVIEFEDVKIFYQENINLIKVIKPIKIWGQKTLNIKKDRMFIIL